MNKDALSSRNRAVRPKVVAHYARNMKAGNWRPGGMNNELALIDTARKALAEARTIDDTVNIRDQARTLEVLAKARFGAGEAAQYATEIRLRAERKIGELTRAMEKAPAGRPKKIGISVNLISKKATLAKFGIEKSEAARCERLAGLPETIFEEEVVKPGVTTSKLVRLSREINPSKKPKGVRVPRKTRAKKDVREEAARTFIQRTKHLLSLDHPTNELLKQLHVNLKILITMTRTHAEAVRAKQ